MTYTVDINNTVESLSYCLKRLQEIDNIYDWRVSVNAGGIDYGLYFNFDTDTCTLEICNCPDRYADYTDMDLDEIIDAINEELGDEDDYEDEDEE